MTDIERLAAIQSMLAAKVYPPTDDVRWLASRLAAAPPMYDALVRIAASEEECGCAHDTDECCNRVDVFCARCIAAAALANVEGR